MLTLRRHGQTEAERGGKPRARSVVVAVGLHLVLGVALWQALQFPRALGFFFDQELTKPSEERIRFLTVAPPRVVASAPRPFSPPSRRPDRPDEPQGAAPAAPGPPVAPAPIVAPTEVPTGIPKSGGGAVVEGPSSGPLITGKGVGRGVQPGYTEPRIWIESPAVTAPGLEGEEKLDSAVAALVFRYRDSVVANTYQPNKYERGDWTYTTKDGKKYGIDQKFIRLGKVSIPTALLGLLPMNQMQNPIAAERQKRLDAMRVEILAQAQMAMNEEEFRRAVKQIRERKERERREAEKKKKKDEVKVISP